MVAVTNRVRTDYPDEIISGPGKVNAVDISTADHVCDPPATHLYVGTIGNVIYTDLYNQQHTLTAPQLGVWHVMGIASIVKDVGTSAGAMLVGWPQ